MLTLSWCPVFAITTFLVQSCNSIGQLVDLGLIECCDMVRELILINILKSWTSYGIYMSLVNIICKYIPYRKLA